jgi:hypothetical protein
MPTTLTVYKRNNTEKLILQNIECEIKHDQPNGVVAITLTNDLDYQTLKTYINNISPEFKFQLPETIILKSNEETINTFDESKKTISLSVKAYSNIYPYLKLKRENSRQKTLYYGMRALMFLGMAISGAGAYYSISNDGLANIGLKNDGYRSCAVAITVIGIIATLLLYIGSLKYKDQEENQISQKEVNNSQSILFNDSI